MSARAAIPPASFESSIRTPSAIPDRPGNNRLDSLANIVANPSVGLLFIVPGFDDTLRVNGQGDAIDNGSRSRWHESMSCKGSRIRRWRSWCG